LQVPRTYEALHHHASLFHPELVRALEEGWQSLSPSLKSHWESHRPENDEKNNVELWVSWAYYAYSETIKSEQTLKLETPLSGYLMERITQTGEIFGISQEMDVLCHPEYIATSGISV